MARVFVSHSGVDLERAAEVSGWLTGDGHEVFLDRDVHDGIAGGEDWQRRLHERLRWADAVVCVVSATYVSSLWCAAEVAVAQSRGSRLLPLRAEAEAEHPFLRSVQYIDMLVDAGAARARLREALQRVEAAGGSGWPDDRSPFPGLRAFDTDQHRVFFGRDIEVSALVDLLRSPAERADAAVLMVVGPSGCGKSSLVRAGVLPRMAGEPGWWALSAMLPGRNPVAALARELAASAAGLDLEWSVAEVRRRLDDEGLGAVAEELLLAASRKDSRRRTMLLVVDQLEELLTQTLPADQARFAQLLAPVLGDTMQVVATLRPEFLEPLLVSPGLAGLATRTFTLRPLTPAALRVVIEEPARLAGIKVAPELVARLVSDAEGGEALPLLAYTLAELADGVGRGDPLLASRYEQLGGVRGTLTRQADLALKEAMEASGRGREDVIRALLTLVDVDEDGRPIRWRARLADLESMEAELTPFVRRRLLITDTEPGHGADDRATAVRVAHEAFLTAWAPLAQAITEHSTALRARGGIVTAAAEWVAAGRAPQKLWEGAQLATAINATGADQRIPTVELDPTATEFMRASQRRDTFRRRRLATLLSVLLVAALIGAAVGFAQYNAASTSKKSLVVQLLEQKAAAESAGDSRTALRLAIAADAISSSPESRSILINQVTTAEIATQLAGPSESVRSVAFSPDGSKLVSGDNSGHVMVWNVAGVTASHVADFWTESGPVRSVTFSPNGQILAVASEGKTGTQDKTVTLWELNPTPHKTGELPHQDVVTSLAFGVDGQVLATGSSDGSVALWDMSVPSPANVPPLLLRRRAGAVTAVAFSSNGQKLAVGGDDAGVEIWDLRDKSKPQLVGVPLQQGSPVTGIAFGSRPQYVAVGSLNGSTTLWDVTDPSAHSWKLQLPIDNSNSPVFAVAWSQDGRTLASGYENHKLYRWNTETIAHPTPVGGLWSRHTLPVDALAFSPDGKQLASGSVDRTVILWSADDTYRPPPDVLMPLHDQPVSSLSLSSDGRGIATGSEDRTAQIHDLAGIRAPRVVPSKDIVFDVAYSPDGKLLASASKDGTVQLVDTTRPDKSPKIQPFPEPMSSVAFAPNGEVMAAASIYGTIWLLHTNGTGVEVPRIMLPRSNAAIFTIAFSPDGTELAAAGVDRSIKLWRITGPDSADGPHITSDTHSNAVTSVAFAANGRSLVSGSFDGSAKLWNVDPATLALQGGIPLESGALPIRAVAFSADGTTIAAGGDDSSIALWDLTNAAQPRRISEQLRGPYRPVRSLKFTANSEKIGAVSDDGTFEAWDLGAFKEVQRTPVKLACALAGGGLDEQAWHIYVPDYSYRDTCK